MRKPFGKFCRASADFGNGFGAFAECRQTGGKEQKMYNNIKTNRQ